MTQASEAPTGAPLDTEASDAELISRVRGGDVDAYGGLFERHRDAANRLARQLLPGPDADDLVAEAFSKVLNVLLAGGGPDVALRPYLLTAIRRLHVDKIRATKRAMPIDDLTPYDKGEAFDDTVISGFEGGAAAQAFASLPERWQLVLWHLEVEGQKPADIAPLLGMSANSVSALAYRAREGLRQAFLQKHTADLVEEDCRWTHDKLGAYVRKGLSRRDNVKVEDHLDGCRKCTAIFLELRELNSELAALLGPAILGTAAAGYLAAGSTAAGVVKGGVLVTLLGGAKDKLANPATAVAAAAAMAVAVAGGLMLANSGDDNPPTAANPPSSKPAPPTDSAPPAPPAAPPTAPPPDAPPTAPPVTQPVVAPPTTVDTVAPTAPSHLRVITTTARSGGARAMAAGVTGFRAVWDKASDDKGVTSYEVFANGKRLASVHGTNYSFSRLEQRKKYAVWVVARDEAGNRSARSNTVRFSTDPAAPPPLSDNEAPVLGAVEVTAADTSLDFHWTASDNVGVRRYAVTFDGRPVPGTTTPAYHAGSLAPGSSHTITVVAYDAAGNASLPRTRTARTTSAPVDHPPSAPLIAVQLLVNHAATITWPPSSDPDGDAITYTVQIDGHVVVSGLTGTSYTTPVLSVGTHVIVVIAVAGGEATPSSPFEVTVPAPVQTVAWDFHKQGVGQNPGTLDIRVTGARTEDPINVQVVLPLLAGTFIDEPDGCQAVANIATCSFTSDNAGNPYMFRTRGVEEGDHIDVFRLPDLTPIPESQ